MLRRFILALISLALMIPVCASADGAKGSVRLSPEGRANALAAAAAIDGTALLPDEAFSFLEAVEKCRAELVPGPDGRGETVTGGGLEQTASCLYLALQALPPGTVAFDSLSLYGDAFRGSYVPDGSRAVLVDEVRDLRFVNLSGSVMTISMSGADTLVCTVTFEALPSRDSAPNLSFAREPAGEKPASGVDLSCDGGAEELTNIALAAGSVYDTTLTRGDYFSFNEALGPRKSEYGYVTALNGAGQRVPGGGVDQVASALWLLIRDEPDVAVAAKNVYRDYVGLYVSSAADAICTDEASGTDFILRYTGSGSVSFYVTLSGNVLHCELYRTA